MQESNKPLSILPLVETISIKLGTRCNLKCKYCHQQPQDISVNEDVFSFLSVQSNLKEIRLSGGEPLLYKELITKIKASVGDGVKISMVSNGILLSDTNIQWLNANNIFYGISYDGESNLRGASPDFSQVAKVVNFNGISTVVTSKFNYDKFYEDIDVAMRISGKNLVSYPNFIHQTQDNTNIELVTEETVSTYIEFIANELLYEFDLYSDGIDLMCLPFLRTYLNELNRNATMSSRGVRCCNEKRLQLSVDGRFRLCYYGEIVVGDIYTGVDWDLVESYIPKKCKRCHYWDLCRNHCIANITDNECRIFKELYNRFKEKVGDYFAEQGI